MKTRSAPNRQIAEEAAEWAVLIDGGQFDAAERRALAEWLKASPAHVEELLIAASLLAGVTDAEQHRETSIDDLLARHAPEIVPLFQDLHAANDTAEPDEESTGSHRRGHRWHRPFLAASLAAVTLAGSAYVLGLQHRGPQNEIVAAGPAALVHSEGRLFQTGIGEQRSVVLEDDSVVHIDADSAIRVALSASHRNIELLSGEAMFEVAHDEARPFRVYAGGTMAQAVGTTFNVERSGQGVKVTVVQGKVLVNNHAGDQTLAAPGDEQDRPDNRTVMLAAGQLVEVDVTAAMQQVRPADLEAVISWRNRELSFDNEGLDRIAAKFNRYNRTQIVLTDPALTQDSFSGVFDADDPASFIAFLELTGRFAVDRSQPGQVALSKARD